MVKWLTQRIVAPPCAGSIPVVRPTLKTQGLRIPLDLFCLLAKYTTIIPKKHSIMQKLIGDSSILFYYFKIILFLIYNIGET